MADREPFAVKLTAKHEGAWDLPVAVTLPEGWRLLMKNGDTIRFDTGEGSTPNTITYQDGRISVDEDHK